MWMRKLFKFLISCTVLPIGLVLYIILESLQVAKKIEIKVDKISKGKK